MKLKRGLGKGADVIIVGRYVTQSKDVERAVRDFLELKLKCEKAWTYSELVE